MVNSCTAYNCTSKAGRQCGVSFHLYPREPKRREEWLNATRRENYQPTSSSVLCSRHFRDEDYDLNRKGSMRCLRRDAVPSIFDFPANIGLQSRTRRMSPKRRRTPGPRPKVETTPSNNLPLVDPTYPHSPTSSTVMAKPVPPVKNIKEHVGLLSPTKAKRKLEIALDQIHRQKKKIKLLQQRSRRDKKKITDFKSMLDHLKTKNLISNDGADVLLNSMSGTSVELIKRQLNSNVHMKYPPKLRSFALTLHFYSTKAYNYVRKTFASNLPHPTTLRKWYSNLDGKPGFTQESMEALKMKVKDKATSDQPVICSLLIDEISIRKKVEWDGNQYVGFVNHGNGLPNNDSMPEAKDAFVFMLNSVNDHWKLPIGYFLTNGLKATERANLVKQCLTLVHDTGVKVISLTCDGPSANLSMAQYLGCDLFYGPNMKTEFKHPCTGEPVFFFLDACHMLKLVRNTLAGKGSLVDGEGNIVSWEYIKQLHELQNEQGLHAATKLSKRHIEWENEKMKVKLAAQTLSNSVADALDFCRDSLKLPAFQGSEATAKFCRTFNNLFDVLNSKSFVTKTPYRKPLSTNNAESIIQYLKECENYISNLRTTAGVAGQLILQSNRKTGFLGFLICSRNYRRMFSTLVGCEKPILKYLLAYKLSQDHLEIFFSAIRSRGGFNNNPTARQFETAYKRLLVHHEIKGAEISTGNCIALDETSILYVPSTKKRGINDLTRYLSAINSNDNILETDLATEADEVCQHDHNYANLYRLCTLSDYVLDVVVYIAGYVVRKLQRKISCLPCQKAISDINSPSDLLHHKNRGGLVHPSKDVVQLCHVGEKLFREFAKMGNFFHCDNLKKKIVTTCLKNAPRHIFSSLDDHILEQEPMNNHAIQLMRAIIDVYLTIRLHHHGKSLELDNRVRSKLTKLVLFKNQ